MFDQKSTGSERQQFLQTILQQDETGEEEENEVPDDETINMWIARNDNEFETFQKMDLDRRTEDARTGRKPRLMDETELPAWLLREEDDVRVHLIKIYIQRHSSFRSKLNISGLLSQITSDREDDDERDYGRGSRQRKDVDYSDSLTDREWLKCIGVSIRLITAENT